MWLLILTMRACNRKFNKLFTHINVRLSYYGSPLLITSSESSDSHTKEQEGEGLSVDVCAT